MKAVLIVHLLFGSVPPHRVKTTCKNRGGGFNWLRELISEVPSPFVTSQSGMIVLC